MALGKLNISLMCSSIPCSLNKRPMTRVAIRECPPKSKKSSSAVISATPSAERNSAKMHSSTAEEFTALNSSSDSANAACALFEVGGLFDVNSMAET
ncbi:Uncharacterised protein [Vibrio cholerae]|nr:Uncharacterised protein [Vibrio cholerae]